MGNEHPKEKNKRQNYTEELNAESQSSSLSSCSFVFDRLKEGNEHLLTLDHFRGFFFPDSELISNSLYRWMTYKANQSEGITQEEFESFCHEIGTKSPRNNQLLFYYGLFSQGKAAIKQSDCKDLLEVAFNAALTLCCCPQRRIDANHDTSLMKNVLKSLFGHDDEIDNHRFVSFMERTCHGFIDALHQLVCHRLAHGYVQSDKLADLPVYHILRKDRQLLSLSDTWLLSCTLPHDYVPASSSSHFTDNKLPFFPILDDGWCLLYDSNHQGLSVNRFQHHVFQYKGPTLTLVAFDEFLYCVAVTEEWRESPSWWGGDSCVIHQLRPEFKKLKSGDNLVFLNFSLRSREKGIHFGSPAAKILEIDGDLHKIKYYGVNTRLSCVEVWGCGGKAIKHAQQRQKDWEKKDALKHKDRKLKIDAEEWKNSPDRQILEMGGVTTEHAER